MQTLTHKRVARQMSAATLSASGDTTLASVSASPSAVGEGESLTFSAEFANFSSEATSVSVIWYLGDKSVERAEGTIDANAHSETLTSTMSYSNILNHVDRAGTYTVKADAIIGENFRQESASGNSVTIEEQTSGGGGQNPDPGTSTLVGLDRSVRTLTPGDTVDLYSYYTNESDSDVSVTTTFRLGGTTVATASGSSPAHTSNFNIGTTVSYSDLKSAVGGTGTYRLSATASFDQLDKTDQLTDGQIELVSDTSDGGGGGGGGSGGSTGSGLPKLPGPTVTISGMEIPVLLLGAGGMASLLFLVILTG